MLKELNIIELSIIKLILVKENYSQAIGSGLTITDFPKELQSVFSCIANYHSSSSEPLSVDDCANLFFSTSTKDREFYISLFQNLKDLDVQDATSQTLLSSLLHKKKLKEISLAAYDAYEGKNLEKFKELIDGLETDNNLAVSDDGLGFVDDSLEDLVNSEIAEPGLRWRLKTLNLMLGSLRKGDFGFIFARPETGKTTFLASEETFMAEQLKEEDGPILHINNEEGGKKVRLRMYQALLGCDLSTLFSNIPAAEKQFRARTHDKLKLVDKAGIHRRDVEALCQKYKPSLLTLDQIDKIQGFDNDREDLRLGAIYQWARELAKTYCPVIAVCQADGTADGQRWLTMGHVANAKTAKQAEADWILGIGKVHDSGYEAMRFLHASKNKLMGDKDSNPALRHGKVEVLIEPTIARFKDLTYA